MGWNTVAVPLPGSVVADGDRYYFVHSFHLRCDDEQDVAATSSHGEPFVAAVRHRNVHGVQFHPEKSHAYGMRVLQAFAELEPAAT